MEKKTIEEAFKDIDEAVCMICDATGDDKRTLVVRCFYAVDELVPEMIATEEGYFARICKSCRGSFLGKMGEWRAERIALRGIPKNHDGYVLEEDSERNIPMRVNGMTVMMTEAEYREHKK